VFPIRGKILKPGFRVTQVVSAFEINTILCD